MYIALSTILIISAIVSLTLTILSWLITADLYRLKKAGHNGIVGALYALFLFLTMFFIWNLIVGITNLPFFEIIVINSHSHIRFTNLAAKLIIMIYGNIRLYKFKKVWDNG